MLAARLLVAATVLTGACSKNGSKPADRPVDEPGRSATTSGATYQQRRRAFTTKLVREGPAPQPYRRQPPPEGVREVAIESGDLSLKAWLIVPPSENARRPAVVFFHGGFALGAGDLEVTVPFLREGFVVLAPMLRGENGNPGNFELFLGEVDDGAAAVRWLAEQPFVDPDHIYTFGHSAGGAISALLSLAEDVPIAHGGSSGGIYTADVFGEWDIVPFDPKRADEVDMRLLLGNTADMKRRHFAYIGAEDRAAAAKKALDGERGGAPTDLRIIEVPGDHFTSVRGSIERYLECIRDPGSC